MAALVFRRATIDDTRAIAELHARSWQQNYRGAFSDTYLDDEALADRMKVWADRLGHPAVHQLVYVAEFEKCVVGFICAFFKDDVQYGTLVDNLHVSSEMKGKGIGKQLMNLIANEIKRGQHEQGMYLWVLEQNSGAHRFYTALGGEKKETVPGHDIGDRSVMKVRYYWSSMEKLLSKTTLT